MNLHFYARNQVREWRKVEIYAAAVKALNVFDLLSTQGNQYAQAMNNYSRLR